ncbi:rhodanese-like domain-containing protein [uncultured Polaribacter sp.]|mgnify:FL=1|uniref:rhodanese-like domain-containing protein n=1 Tax=uncultured Polaribacter sp. TaxID=174711 RepID=UPI0030DA0A7A|tara:strand:+ start:2563 stop:3174 length:612 start_codon:yes stop_codon:yes gene_type:complete
MKELEKTKRISIVSTLFILAVLIGLFTYKRPKNTYAFTTKSTLEKLSNDNYFISLNDTNTQNNVLIDVRNAYEFEKGHLYNAININTPDLLNDENLELLKEYKNTNKTVVLYGNNPQEINLPFLLLYQLGYDNIKLLPVEITYHQNKLITKKYDVETSKTNIKDFINQSIKNADSDAIIPNANPIKKTIVVRQKKKKKAEGGC